MPSRFRFRRALPVAFALLAFFGLLGRGAVPLAVPAAQGAGNLAALAKLGAVICHGDAAEEHDPAAPGRNHAPDCALCPVCQLQAPWAHLLHPAPPVILAAPAPLPTARYALDSPRAPPAAAWRPAQPRGPPLPV